MVDPATALEGLPPAQRAQMEAMYESFQNNAKTGEVCTVSPTALGFNAHDFEVSRQLAAFMRD